MASGDAAIACRGPKVVVIEDNFAVAQMLTSVLASVGFDVVVATNGREGMDAVVAHAPSVILLDLHLPDMHGGSVLQAIRADKAFAATPVIILTASDKVSDVLQAASCGANDYMTKPFDAATLVTKVSQYARQRRTQAPSVRAA